MNKLIYKTWIFEDDQVKSGSCYLETSLPSSSLGINTLETVVKCADAAIADFAQNDPVTYYYKGVQRGIYYIQSVERIGPDRYTLTAVSALGLLAQKRHPGGIYTGQTVQEVVTDICGDIPVIIKSNLANIALYGWLPYVAPPKSSAKDNLSQVLFAIGAAVTNDLDGVLRIEPLWSGVSGVLDDDHVCQGGKVTTEPAVTAVSVTEHQYFQGGESKELFDGSTQSGDIITFDEPAYDLTAEGFTILESGANYAKVSAGSGKLTGKTYIHNTRQVTVEVTPGPVENIKTPSGNPTLVSLVNSYAVAQRLAAYYKCRDTIKVPALIGGNRPGAVVSMYHPYDKKMVTACLEVTDAHMSSVIKADLEALVGYEPPDIAQQEYYDAREVLTGEGDWERPNDADTVTVVCIGGGTGGYGGANGQDGKKGGTSGNYGEGGLGGNGGIGGRIHISTIQLTDETSIPYHTGTGGNGGASNGGVGSEGGASVFGPVTSADGASSENGYTDIFTGDVFASTGDVGQSGARGGEGGGVTASKSEDGQSIGDNVGGTGGSGRNYGGTSQYPGFSYGAGGGGAAIGGDGGAGGNGSMSRNTSQSTTTAYGGTGGTGGNAQPPAKATGYGKGGTGGNGGGGGGGGGNAVQATKNYPGSGGTGGNGSIGGQGGDGCIILYYRKVKTIKSGSVMDKTGRFALDRTGRLMVV